MPSVIRKHCWSLTHGTSGTLGAYGAHRTSGTN
jgi:hypothetical protein